MGHQVAVMADRRRRHERHRTSTRMARMLGRRLLARRRHADRAASSRPRASRPRSCRRRCPRRGATSIRSGNPHVWLDPVNAKQIAKNIAAGLTRVDPTNARRPTPRTSRRSTTKIDDALYGHALVEEYGSSKLERLSRRNELIDYLKKQGHLRQARRLAEEGRAAARPQDHHVPQDVDLLRRPLRPRHPRRDRGEARHPAVAGLPREPDQEGQRRGHQGDLRRHDLSDQGRPVRRRQDQGKDGVEPDRRRRRARHRHYFALIDTLLDRILAAAK